MELTKTFQVQLFDDLLKVFPKNDLVKILSKLLNKQSQDCYRRISGKYSISVDELFLLIKGLKEQYDYELSIDRYFFQPSEGIQFTFNVFEKKIESFENYLDQFYDNLNRVKQMDDMVMYYGPNDLPLTFYGFTPKLLSFKLYVYGITLWDFQHLENTKFSFDLVSPVAIEKGRAIGNIYLDITSHEIWMENLLESTLNQLVYFTLTNRFAIPQNALEICDELLLLIKHLEEASALGYKLAYPKTNHQGAPFDIYLNDVSNTIDTVYAYSPTIEVVFTSFRTPNFLRTTDKKLCQYTKNWMELIMKKSPQLNVTPVERIQFFNRLENKVISTRNRVKSIIN